MPAGVVEAADVPDGLGALGLRVVRGVYRAAHHLRVQGSGFGVQGSGFRAQGSGCRVQGSGFRFQASGFSGSGVGWMEGGGWMVGGVG